MQKNMIIPESIMIGKIGEYGPLADHTLREKVKKFKAVGHIISHSRYIEISQEATPEDFKKLMAFLNQRNIPVYDKYGNKLIGA